MRMHKSSHLTFSCSVAQRLGKTIEFGERKPGLAGWRVGFADYWVTLAKWQHLSGAQFSHLKNKGLDWIILNVSSSPNSPKWTKNSLPIWCAFHHSTLTPNNLPRSVCIVIQFNPTRIYWAPTIYYGYYRYQVLRKRLEVCLDKGRKGSSDHYSTHIIRALPPTLWILTLFLLMYTWYPSCRIWIPWELGLFCCYLHIQRN